MPPAASAAAQAKSGCASGSKNGGSLSPAQAGAASTASSTSSSSSGGPKGSGGASGGGNSNNGTGSGKDDSDPFEGEAIWDMPAPALKGWIEGTCPLDRDPSVASELWSNLEKSLDCLREVERPVVDDEDGGGDASGGGGGGDDDDGPNGNGKRGKKGGGSNGRKNGKKKRKQVIRVLHDPYRVWLQAWKDYEDRQEEEDEKEEEQREGQPPPPTRPPPAPKETLILPQEADDVPSTAGGKLAHLTLGGLVNAFACVSGTGAVVPFRVTPSASQVPPAHLRCYAAAARLHRAASARVYADILRTTPLRIQSMLAGDLTAAEMAAVRKRVYDTVILGKGMHANDPTAAEEDDLVVAGTAGGGSGGAGASASDAYQKCGVCGNNDQSLFVLDRKNGDVICSNCGTVVSESIMHEGSQFRKFEGEADRNHHGDAANPLYSNAHNMSTTLGGGSVGMVRGGMGSGKRSNLETILRNAHAYTELNVSQFGKTDRRTRVGYKDKQKKEAFVQMAHVGDALNLHEAVVQRAKELFAGFRDDRELIQQFKAVIAACLCEAFEQLSQEGKAILKRDQQQQDEEAAKQSGGGDPAAAAKGASSRPLSARAARRNELHHATLAGKGGLIIDFSNLNKDSSKSGAAGAAAAAGTPGSASTTPSAATSPKATDKPAAAWTLLDCRSWLLDASRRIAQQWVDQRNKAADDPAKAAKFPSGTLEELEGRLVEHSIALCEQLEVELQSRGGAAASAVSNKKRTVTPRVQDMSRLGIKWQHSHERGSGGKGGVGGSGQGRGKMGAPAVVAGRGGRPGANGVAGGAGGGNSGRTAGQILILKTGKKLGAILNDPVAGEAFHKELTEVRAQQETRKQQLLREELSRQRLQQMKRKPWLQARLQA